jgi:hypothetical protein
VPHPPRPPRPPRPPALFAGTTTIPPARTGPIRGRIPPTGCRTGSSRSCSGSSRSATGPTG